MEPSEIISAYRNSSQTETLYELGKYFSFNPQKQADGEVEDANLELRTGLTEHLLHDFSLQDQHLIRLLFQAELNCEREIWRHDNLYQLSFYLYSLGQMEDSFLLYEAKYGIKHMDASTMQDQYSITVGHEPDEIIEYAKKRFDEDPTLKEKYSGLLDELHNIKEERNYGSIADYTRFINGYFYGHDKFETESDNKIPGRQKKPWWKFW